ncbi:MAG: hypothetical protein JSS58_07095 [Proteobacteria bacterium]|nr:hypothetical protein [Pseudomonadota bacterium]
MWLALVIVLSLGACATTGSEGDGILVDTTSNRQALPGANCVASNNNGNWNFVTPAAVRIAGVNGDLRIVCNKLGFRTSEYVFRPTGAHAGGPSVGLGVGGGSRVGFGIGFSIPIGGFGGGSYPRQVTLDLTPL